MKNVVANKGITIADNGKISRIFVNPAFAKHMKAIAKAQASFDRNSWIIARHVVEIVNDDLWKSDFPTQDDFAAYINVSSGAISQWKKAVDYAEKNPQVKELGYTLTRAYIYGSMKDDDRIAFQSWISQNNVDIATDTALKIAKKYWKDYKGDVLPVPKEVKGDYIDVPADTPEAEKSEVTKPEISEAESKNVKFLKISFGGNTYAIPEKDVHKVLKKYLVK